MCITFVTVGELMKWRVLRSWGLSRTDELARWRQHVGVLAYDEAVADKWGQLPRLPPARSLSSLARSYP
jgi:toxin FitB